MSLPYAQSKADPSKAQSRIREMLKKFGVQQLSFVEDFEKGILTVYFKYKEYPVMVPISVHKLAEAFLKRNPYTSRKHSTKEEWESKYFSAAHNGVFSIMEDLIKSLITIVSVSDGQYSFEEIFFSFFINKNGKRMGEMIKDNLPKLIGSGLGEER